MSRKTSPSKFPASKSPTSEKQPQTFLEQNPAPTAPTPKPVAAKVETAEERVERERKEMAAVVR